MSMLPRELETTSDAAVRTRSLVRRYGSTMALDGVDITVPQGSVYVLVGQNGAGKTTLLKVLLDLVVADAGAAEVFGIDTHRDAAGARAQIGYVPERDVGAWGWMRVQDLLRYHAGYYAQWDAAYASELATFFQIRPDARLRVLSKGQQRRVQLLLAMAHRPPLLVLDEPTDGLDPLMRDRTAAAMADHMARFPTTLLISTHHIDETERLCDHLCVLHEGRIEAQLSRDMMRRRLRRYALEVPAGWAGAPALGEAVLAQDGAARELAWTVWGDEADIVAALTDAGATVREVNVLSVQQAALVLLAHAEGSHADDAHGAATSHERAGLHAAV